MGTGKNEGGIDDALGWNKLSWTRKILITCVNQQAGEELFVSVPKE